MSAWRWMFPPILTVLLISVISRAQEASEPLPLPALLESAETLKAAGQWDAALAALGEAVARRAEDEESAAKAQLLQGRYRLQMAMPVEAEQALRDVEYLFPSHVEQVHWSRLFLIDALRFQGRPGDAEAVARSLLADPSASAKQIAWCRVSLGDLLKEAGRLLEAEEVLAPLDAIVLPDGDVGPIVEGGLKRAEILLAWGQPQAAAPVLENIIARATTGYGNQVNWARVRLLEAMTQSHSLSDARGVIDRVIWDHGAGLASEQQLAWAFIWQGRGLKQTGQYESAIAPLQMAASTADANWPDVAFEAEFEMGEAYRLLGNAVDEGAEYHVAALGYYHAAYQRAQDANLPEGKRDQALLQVGSEMRHLGMRDRAIAWLRRGIENPVRLSDSDHLLVSRIGEFLGSAERDTWYEYMVDPASGADPTAGIVRAEFGTEASTALPGNVNRAFERRYWKAKLFLRQRRYEEGAASLEEASVLATTPGEHLSCLVGLAYCSMRLEGKAASLPYAHEAADLCMNIILGPHDGDAHFAIFQAASVYGENCFDKEELEVLEHIAAMPELRDYPSRLAVAKYRLMREYTSEGFYDEALALGEELLCAFQDHPFGPGHSTLCTWASIDLAYRYADLGDAEAVNEVLDQALSRFGGEFGTDIELQRGILLNRLHGEWNQ